MNVGKALFAQVMEFVPWKTFGRIVARYHGDAGVRTLGCADVFRVMAFAQLTWRMSLRDIEVCLTANQAKLFQMGLQVPRARSALADALNLRDWRIYHAMAQRLIARARALHAYEPSVLELEASVYALDSTTIDPCPSLFDWAPFRSNKAASKLHTLLDLRGAIPAFIHVSDGKLHDVHALDLLPMEAGSFYVMYCGYLAERLYAIHQAGAASTRRPRTDRAACSATGASCSTASTRRSTTQSICHADPASGKTLVFLTNDARLPALTIYMSCPCIAEHEEPDLHDEVRILNDDLSIGCDRLNGPAVK